MAPLHFAVWGPEPTLSTPLSSNPSSSTVSSLKSLNGSENSRNLSNVGRNGMARPGSSRGPGSKSTVRSSAELNSKLDTKARAKVAKQVRAVQFLLESNAYVDVLDRRCTTPLMIAARRGGVEAARLLLQRGASKDATDIYGNTPLHYAYAFRQMDVVALLLKQGAPPFAENRGRQTPEDVMATRSKIFVGGATI